MPARELRLVAALAALSITFTSACSKKSDPRATAPAPVVTSTSTEASAGPASASIDAIARFGDCTLSSRGVLLDLGTPHDSALLSDRRGVEPYERDGATWTRVSSRSMTMTFVATAEDVAAMTDDGAAPVVEARVRGGAARSIAVILNGKPAGTWKLTKGEAVIVSAKLPPAGPNGAQLVAGTNELQLRFIGGAKAGAAAPDEGASIDWIHVGGSVEGDAFGAPTREDALTSTTIGGTPMRAVSLRAPAHARCSGWLPPGGRVELSVGAAGTGGEGDVEIRVLRDRAPAVSLAKVHVKAADGWRRVDVPLGDLGKHGTLGSLDLVATRATHGARVVFGEPRVVEPTASPLPPSAPDAPAKSVVLVVLGHVSPRDVDVYGGKIAMPALSALAKDGVAFDANRAPTSVSSGALAAMITGAAPLASGVIDDDAALPSDVTTLADAARQAGIDAAFFTANPMTSGAFGFSRGWTTFVEHDPDAEGVATQVFDDAASWISNRAKSDARFLVVIHARGGHPPWEASAEDLKTLAPIDYTGVIDPQHAAEILARARHVPPSFRLADSDRARLWGLYAVALRSHDAAIGRLVSALRAAGREKDTLVVVASDTSVDDLARVPFGDGDSLEEGALDTPLVVRGPRFDAFAGRHVASPTSSVDVARTILASLGLTPPTGFGGLDLARLAAGEVVQGGRPQLAALGSRFSLRWGSFVLAGAISDASPRDAKLCDLSLEPSCVSDVRGAFPIALEALHRETARALAEPAHARTPAIESAKTTASLKAWGR